MWETRHRFHQDLEEFERRTLKAIDLVVAQLDSALQAVGDHDRELAERVIAADARIDGLYVEVHDGVLLLIARQAPVADDLRLIAALLHVIRCTERIGDQCVNIAKLVPLSDEEAPQDREILDAIGAMGQFARDEVTDAAQAFKTRHVSLARALTRQGLEVHRLNRAIFARALQIGEHAEVRAWAMLMILAARALERIADNALEIADQSVYVVTGLLRESTPGTEPA